MLEPFRDKLPRRGVQKEYEPPVTDGSGNNRDKLRQALGAVQGAG